MTTMINYLFRQLGYVPRQRVLKAEIDSYAEGKNDGYRMGLAVGRVEGIRLSRRRRNLSGQFIK